MNTQLAQLKAELKTIIQDAMNGLKLDSVLIDRTNTLVQIMKVHNNEDLVVGEVVTMVIEKFRNNPELVYQDSVIVDGVMSSPVTDEQEVWDVLAAMDTHCRNIGTEGAATVAFITLATAEAMLEVA